MLVMAEREDRSQRLAAAGSWLVAARRKAGLTQDELGDAIGTTGQSISNYERGVAAVPDEAAERIARALGVGIIATRRGLGLWVPDDAEDEPVDNVDLVAMIRRDPNLVPEARRHFEAQYKLLRRLSAPAPDAETAEDPAASLLKLPHAARKRSPRKPRT